jgi:hypothetical protein
MAWKEFPHSLDPEQNESRAFIQTRPGNRGGFAICMSMKEVEPDRESETTSRTFGPGFWPNAQTTPSAYGCLNRSDDRGRST